jgi:hypothetical protein
MSIIQIIIKSRSEFSTKSSIDRQIMMNDDEESATMFTDQT